MRSKEFTAIAIVAALGALVVLPAEAQQVKKKVSSYRAPGQTVFVSRGEDGRTRTRIIVQRRSFLDGGTEVLPGERKYSDYAIPPNYSAYDAVNNTAFYHRPPLLGPWDFPGKNNPYGW